MSTEPAHESEIAHLREQSASLQAQVAGLVERTQSMLDNLRDGILIEDAQRRIEWANTSFCAMFGLDAPPESLIGADCAHVTHLCGRLFTAPDAFLARIDQLVAAREMVRGDLLYMTDGHILQRDYVPLLRGAETLGHRWQYRDVTVQVQAQQRQQRLIEMEKCQQRILNLFIQANDNVDSALDQGLAIAGELLHLSRAYVFHFRRNERILDNTHEWCAPGVNPEIENLKGLPFDTLVPSFFPMLTRDGLIVASDITTLPEDIRGLLQPQGILSILIAPLLVDARLDGFVGFDETRVHREWLPEEITVLHALAESYTRSVERQRARNALIEARDAALRSARLKAQFMSNMSHEIRTPMTGVIGMLELLRETALDDDQREFVESAYVSAHRLLDIINDVLDFSRIEAGQVVLSVGDVNLADVILEVKTTLIPLAARNRVEVHIDIAPDVPRWIVGDAARVRQVIMNLAGNAIKFTRDGQVTIRVRRLSASGDLARVRIEIEDTGIGIEAHQLSHIFESFTQADGTITRRFGGTGLGLAICKQLVEMMGGEIDVRSTPGIGSVFGFQVCMPVSARAAPGTGNTDWFAALRVLVADQEHTARYVLSQQVRTLNANVVEIGDVAAMPGVLGTAAQKGTPFDIVLLQYRPPNADYESILAEVRHTPGLQPRKVVVVVDPEQGTEPAPALYDACLERPVRQSALYDLFMGVIRVALSPAASPADIKPAIRVLAAEDNPDTRAILEHVFPPDQIQIDIVPNGKKALELLETTPYALALIDIQMPEVDGIDVIKAIRSSSAPYHDIPVIALTASVFEDEVKHYRALGFSDVVAKPFSFDFLRSVVKAHLNIAE